MTPRVRHQPAKASDLSDGYLMRVGSIEHQDRCGDAGMPLIVVDRQGNEVPVPAGVDPPAFAERLGPGHEALIRCIEHPETPAVDCLICVPEDDES